MSGGPCPGLALSYPVQGYPAAMSGEGGTPVWAGIPIDSTGVPPITTEQGTPQTAPPSPHRTGYVAGGAPPAVTQEHVLVQITFFANIFDGI